MTGIYISWPKSYWWQLFLLRWIHYFPLPYWLIQCKSDFKHASCPTHRLKVKHALNTLVNWVLCGWLFTCLSQSRWGLSFFCFLAFKHLFPAKCKFTLLPPFLLLRKERLQAAVMKGMPSFGQRFSTVHFMINFRYLFILRHLEVSRGDLPRVNIDSPTESHLLSYLQEECALARNLRSVLEHF